MVLYAAAFGGRAGGGIQQCLGDRLRNQMVLCKANLQCACSPEKASSLANNLYEPNISARPGPSPLLPSERDHCFQVSRWAH